MKLLHMLTQIHANLEALRESGNLTQFWRQIQNSGNWNDAETRALKMKIGDQHFLAMIVRMT